MTWIWEIFSAENIECEFVDTGKWDWRWRQKIGVSANQISQRKANSQMPKTEQDFLLHSHLEVLLLSAFLLFDFELLASLPAFFIHNSSLTDKIEEKAF